MRGPGNFAGGAGHVRSPSFKGRYRIYVRNGKTVIAGWPKPRGKNVSPKQRAAIDTFKEASEAVKYMDAGQLAFARRAADGTVFLWRDICFMALYGRLWWPVIDNQGSWVSVASRNDISQILDAITQSKGNMLIRGTDWWEGLTPGLDSLVLTSNGPGELPSWKVPAAGNAGRAFAIVPPDFVSGSAFAAKGLVLTPAVAVTLHQLQAWVQAGAGETYSLKIFAKGATTLGPLLADGGTISPSSADPAYLTFTLASPLDVLANTEIVILLTRTDAGNTEPCNIYFTQDGTLQFPISATPSFARVASNDPQPNDAAEYLPDIPCIGPIYVL